MSSLLKDSWEWALIPIWQETYDLYMTCMTSNQNVLLNMCIGLVANSGVLFNFSFVHNDL